MSRQVPPIGVGNCSQINRCRSGVSPLDAGTRRSGVSPLDAGTPIWGTARRRPYFGTVAMIVLAALVGCHPQEPFYLKNVDNDQAYYMGKATQIEYPDVKSERLPDVSEALPPWSLKNRDIKSTPKWELTLEEAIQLALKNNKVMRNIGGQVQGPPDFITRNPEVAPTIYDPALAESNPRTGPEAALSMFDAQLQTSLTWEKQDAPQNINPSWWSVYSSVNDQDLGTFQTRLQKTAASGGTFALSHSVAYDMNYKSPTQLYSSDWNVKLVAEVRQPLLQGAGPQFNRIAGPGATPGNFNGVMIARINTDIALANFEAGVRNLVSDVEIAYWELYFQYRSLDAVIAGRDSALETWRRIYTLYTNGSKGGEAEKEAQSRAQYFLFRSTAEQSLNSLYATEAKLRYLLGLAATDGRLIRPKDEPTTAKVTFDWYDVLNEGLARNVELREQKWIVKRRELELIAAKNFLLPRLDLVGQYRWLGFGNRLDGDGTIDMDDSTGLNSNTNTNAYRSLMGGSYQEYQLGFQGTIPLGFRRELAGVRNAQLEVIKEQSKLQEGELELSHQLAYAIRDLETNHVLSETDFNRRIAALRQKDAVAAAYDTGSITLDVLLNAQQELARAESDYYRALVDYNKSIAQVHYRKGSLLEYNGVYLAEGPWPAKAYFDARRRSHERAASYPLDYGFTQPKVFSRGPIEQHAGAVSAMEAGQQESAPTPAPLKSEPVPTPAPEPVSSNAFPAEPSAGGNGGATVAPTQGEPALAPEPAEKAPASGGGESDGQWKAASKGSAAARRVDRELLPAGWTVAEKGGNHEPNENPPSPAVDWSAAGWKRVQR
jgi:outer membrane protein TolC